MTRKSAAAVVRSAAPAGAFSARVNHLDGEAIVELSGDLTADDAPALRDLVWPLLGRYESDMVSIDCTRLQHLEPAGLVVLVRFARAITPGRTNLRALQPGLRRVVEEAGYETLFDFDRIVLR